MEAVLQAIQQQSGSELLHLLHEHGIDINVEAPGRHRVEILYMDRVCILYV
jgi:hypothetical protein